MFRIELDEDKRTLEWDGRGVPTGFDEPQH